MSNSISALANTGMDITTPSGKTLRIKKLSMLDISADVEAAVRSRCRAEYIEGIAAIKDPDIKKELVKSISWQCKPPEDKWKELVSDEFKSSENAAKIVRKVLSRAKADESDIEDMLADNAMITQVLDFVVGSDSIKAEGKAEGTAETVPTQPPTTGTI